MKPHSRYIALLRGINVGGKSIVKMSELADAFTSLGFTNVRTHINSGNVLFDTFETDEKKLVAMIEKKLEEAFGRPLATLLRPQQEIQNLVARDPYKMFDMTDTSLYFIVSFLTHMPEHSIKLPYTDDDLGLVIVSVLDREILLVLDRKKLAETGKAMKFIGKTFPVTSTTRTWNTLVKLATL